MCSYFVQILCTAVHTRALKNARRSTLRIPTPKISKVKPYKSGSVAMVAWRHLIPALDEKPHSAVCIVEWHDSKGAFKWANIGKCLRTFSNSFSFATCRLYEEVVLSKHTWRWTNGYALNQTAWNVYPKTLKFKSSKFKENWNVLLCLRHDSSSHFK